MSLLPGTRLGAYDIIALLGAGGMGEVYRARDTRLKREVAIKILPDAFASDPDRLARFQREAELLATLNHPNIGAVYGLEQGDLTGGSEDQDPPYVRAIVLELIEGKTLADLLSHGPLPVDRALDIARQIAEALEAAHERGIIHRDLKPANVKITPDDKVKVLDFGLAKLAQTASDSGLQAQGLSHSPTLSVMATHAGMILGTAAYMSPEQAKGLPVDQRSDIFSFGCVLYEMLTGRSPFHADTAAEIFASVIVREADLTLLPSTLSPRLRDLIRRCLDKHPKKRWQAIGDVRAELESLGALPHIEPSQGKAGALSLLRRALPLLVACLLTGVVVGLVVWNMRPSSLSPVITRFPIVLGERSQVVGMSRGAIAISPDGSRIAYVSNGGLTLRSMGDVEAKLIPGTNLGINNPVFSPDGQSIAFVASDRTLKRIAISGGAAVTLCPAEDSYGITWTEDSIFVGQGAAGIFRVSPYGGTPEYVVKVNADEQAHGPQLLPDGETLLFTLAKGRDITRWAAAQIVLQSLKSGTRTTLINGGTDARYLPTGHIVYLLRGVVLATPFDPRRLTLTGGPVPVIEGVATPGAATTGAAQFSVSQTGSLVYFPGPVGSDLSQRVLALVDRSGAAEPLKLPPAAYDSPRASPDGRQIAVVIDDAKGAHVWMADPSGTAANRRLTFGGMNRFPIWSADGERVAYQSDREGDLGIFWQRADGSGPAERLTKAEPGSEHRPDSWSADGKSMAFTVVNGIAARISILNVGDRKATTLAETPSKYVSRASFSPNGRWIAYSSDETGRPEIFVQPYPPTGARYQIGSAGGQQQRGVVWWSPAGNELLFNEGPLRWFAVSIVTHPTFTYSSPRAIPRAGLPNRLGATGPRNYDQMPDGQKMLVVASGEPNQPGATRSEIHVVLNWFEELNQRVPLK